MTTQRIIFEVGEKTLADHFAVAPLKREVPQWYKDLDMHISPGGLSLDAMISGGAPNGNKTMKYCVPVLDYLTSGYVIKAAMHLKIRNGEKGKGDVAPGLQYVTSHTERVEHHAHAQCPFPFHGRKHTYPKLGNPWTVITPPGYSCLFYQPFYADIETNLRMFPAIVDTDTFPVPVNFPGMVLGDGEAEIVPGQPLMAVFPFKREEWRMEVRVRDKPEDRGLMGYLLHRAYKAFYHRPKSFK